MKRIKLLINYSGVKTHGRIIPAGEYDASKPPVKDVADYLVQNGHAIVTVDEPETPKRKATRSKTDES